MKRACICGLLVLSALTLGGCQSGSKELAGFDDREGVWFNARGERVHHDQLFASAGCCSKSSAQIGLADIADHAAAPKAQCACCKPAHSGDPRMSGYSRAR